MTNKKAPVRGNNKNIKSNSKKSRTSTKKVSNKPIVKSNANRNSQSNVHISKKDP